MGEPVRIAMWSGPRNLSTAMMRSFGGRGDCAVLDEPFYAAYLHHSGVEHPMKAEVLRAQPTDPNEVERTVLGPVPGGRPLWHQKHMPHHMLPGFPRGWFAACRHFILIRAPERVAASFDAGRPDPTVEDLGAPQMDGVIADIVAMTGREPPVVEAEDIRANPEGMLRALCAALEIPWDAGMLRWEVGRRETDGVWAPHWYRAVEASTGFAPPPKEEPALRPALRPVVEAARPSFGRLRARKLGPVGAA
ncbi:MAG: HAD family hydrolase [Paracoccaceae bacterium]